MWKWFYRADQFLYCLQDKVVVLMIMFWWEASECIVSWKKTMSTSQTPSLDTLNMTLTECFCFNVAQNKMDYHNQGTCIEMEPHTRWLPAGKLVLVTRWPRLGVNTLAKNLPALAALWTGPPWLRLRSASPASRRSVSCFGSRAPSNTGELITVSGAVERNTLAAFQSVTRGGDWISIFFSPLGRARGRKPRAHTQHVQRRKESLFCLWASKTFSWPHREQTLHSNHEARLQLASPSRCPGVYSAAPQLSALDQN